MCSLDMAVMFQGDPLRHSMYREDAVDALVTALEHNLHSRKIQEKCSRALLLLAGRFSSSGEDTAEAWLLRRAGLQDSLSDSFRSREIFLDEIVRPVCFEIDLFITILFF